jgi:hypothetical protein
VRLTLPIPVATTAYTEYGPGPVATVAVAVCVPIVPKFAVSRRVPLGGETPLVGLRNVDSVTEEIASSMKSPVRPFVTLTFPSGEVRPIP